MRSEIFLTNLRLANGGVGTSWTWQLSSQDSTHDASILKTGGMGLTHSPEVPCTILRTLKYSRVAHRIFTLPEIMVRDVNLSINVGLFFFPQKKVVFLKLFSFCKVANIPRYFSLSKVLATFLDTLCLCQMAGMMEVTWQAAVGGGREMVPPPPLCCQANLFSSFCKGNHKCILPTPNS